MRDQPSETHEEGDRIAVRLVEVLPHHHHGFDVGQSVHQVEHRTEYVARHVVPLTGWLSGRLRCGEQAIGGRHVEERPQRGRVAGHRVGDVERQVADDFAGERERDPSIELRGVTGETHGTHPSRPVQDFGGEPGLADSAVAADQHECPTAALGAFELVEERRRRSVAPHEC